MRSDFGNWPPSGRPEPEELTPKMNEQISDQNFRDILHGYSNAALGTPYQDKDGKGCMTSDGEVIDEIGLERIFRYHVGEITWNVEFYSFEFKGRLNEALHAEPILENEYGKEEMDIEVEAYRDVCFNCNLGI